MNRLLLFQFLSLMLLMVLSPCIKAQEIFYDMELARKSSSMEWADVEGAIKYWIAEYESPKSQNNEKYKGDVCLILSKAYNVRRDVEGIELWNKRASDIYEKIGDRRGQAEVLYQKGFASFCKREYEEALEYVLQGIAIMEEIGDEEGVGLGYLRMSRVFHFTLKLQESADYGQRGGEKLESVGDDLNAADAWSFAGHGYRMNGDSASASIAFKRSLALAEKSGVPGVLTMAYNDLASFYMEYDLYEDAEIFFVKSLALAEPEDERQIMVIRNGLSQVYLNTGRYEECIKVSKEALKTVIKTNDIFFLSELPEYIARSYEALMQYDSAYKYMKLNWQYSDSLFTTNQNAALEEMKTKYETETKEKIIARQRREQIYGGVLLLIFGGLALLLFNMYRSKNRINSLLQESNKEKDFLIKEIHHRVKNNLQILSSLLSLQSDAEENEEVLGALQEGRNRVESMGMIHQRLYSQDTLSAINMKEYIPDLCAYLKDMANGKDNDLEIVPHVEVGLADVETAIPLGLIINELITNAIKYAYNVNGATIHVRLWEERHELLRLQVSDDGVSSDSIVSNVSSTQFGTKLVEILSKKLKGEIVVDNKKGYSTIIAFSRYKLVK